MINNKVGSTTIDNNSMIEDWMGRIGRFYFFDRIDRPVYASFLRLTYLGKYPPGSTYNLKSACLDFITSHYQHLLCEDRDHIL